VFDSKPLPPLKLKQDTDSDDNSMPLFSNQKDVVKSKKTDAPTKTEPTKTESAKVEPNDLAGTKDDQPKIKNQNTQIIKVVRSQPKQLVVRLENDTVWQWKVESEELGSVCWSVS
jgi:hypothetical protein